MFSIYLYGEVTVLPPLVPVFVGDVSVGLFSPVGPELAYKRKNN